jgi:uncharacterized membrane protein YcgQ (UPF0703/DUF1980 family)
MKRYFALIVLCLVLLGGCGGGGNGDGSDVDTKTASATDGIIEITEKMFISQCNDVYLNPSDYVGKQVKIEGMLDMYTAEDGSLKYGVIRYGPGCCGNDGVAGFAVNSEQLDLQIDDWIEVIGTFQTEEVDGWTNVVINAEKVTRLEKRGEEFVTQ